MFAVTGITGQVGAAVARSLLAAGQPVRAVVRDRGKGDPWARLGCDVAIAEMEDTGALTTAFEETAGVFAMLPAVFDPAPGFPESTRRIGSLSAALARVKPARVVALSTIGADAPRPNLLNSLGRMEEALGSLPIPVTFLRAAWFMENAAGDIAAAKRGLIQSYLQPLDRAVPMISTEDVGRAAAVLLQERWEGKRVVELESARRVSPNDLAAAFAEVLGTPVRVEAVPRDQWESVFRAQGMQNPTPRIQMMDGFNAGWIDFPDRGAQARKGSIDIHQAIAALNEGDILMAISRRTFSAALVAGTVASLTSTRGMGVTATPTKARNVVLVHGLFADGSCWAEVITRLQAAGLNATSVQNPLTTLPEAVASAERVLARQDGPTVLVGHSFSGMIVTEAGVHPNVSALVYVAARAPDAGEDYPALAKKFPTPPATAGIIFDGDEGRLSEAAFLRDFAGDLPEAKAKVLYAVQEPFQKALLTGRTTQAAWRSKPSFYAVSSEDRTINPDLERFMAKRMGAKTIEVKSSHVSMISHPDEITALILEAAQRG